MEWEPKRNGGVTGEISCIRWGGIITIGHRGGAKVPKRIEQSEIFKIDDVQFLSWK